MTLKLERARCPCEGLVVNTIRRKHKDKVLA